MNPGADSKSSDQSHLLQSADSSKVPQTVKDNFSTNQKDKKSSTKSKDS